ncbi:MFS transporter [Actinoplanes sp. NPDC051470]|uniref:MFS transporter n=1 Tax=unclassified Actinoplanes TaxID=2626549 RepID=UPI003425DD5E
MTTNSVLDKTETPYRWRWAALFVILAVEVMDLLDALVTSIAGPVIRAEIGGSYSLIQWLGAAYTLAMAIGLLTGGRLGDIFGRRRMFLIGAAGFTLASMLCAVSWSPSMLIGARAVQGLFGALMLPQGLGMIRQMFSPAEQAKAFGAFGPVMGLGAVGGPILAGWLVDADYFGAGWRMIFFINLPLGLFAIIGALKFLPEFKSERPLRLDLAGVVLAAIGGFLLLFPLVQGRELDWPVWIFVMLAAGLVVFGLFGAYENRRDKRGLDPLVTPSLFGKRAFTGGLAVGMVFFGALIGVGLIFTLYLQVGLGYSPIKAGLTTLPQAVGMIAGFIAAGSGLTERLGRRLLMLGIAVMLVGTGVVAATVALSGADLEPWHLIAGLLPLGVGMGLAMAPFFNIVLAGVDDEETGSASGALTSVQQLGGAFGIALLGTVFFGLLPGSVTSHVDQSPAKLTAVLAEAGVPAGQQAGVAAGIRACLHDRVAEDDPDVQPASCRAAPAGPTGDRVGEYAQGVVKDAFRDSAVRSLGVAFLMILVAFAAAFLLPRQARPDAGH